MKNTKIYAEYIYDFAVDGGATVSVKNLSAKSGKSPIPVGAVVNHVFGRVLTAPVGTNAEIKLGNTADDDAYMASTAITSFAVNTVVNSQELKGAQIWDDSNDCVKNVLITAANDGDVVLSIATADLTAGKILFGIEYFNPTL